MAEKNERPIKVVAENRKARFNYAIEDALEAGIVVTGTEVKIDPQRQDHHCQSYADTRTARSWRSTPIFRNIYRPTATTSPAAA